jgi:predicted ATPase
MLTRLRVKNFRLLRDVDITFEQDVPTVFVGPNASGKSTVLEVLDFLGRCSREGLQAAVAAHGGMDSIRTVGAAGPMVLHTSWALAGSRTPQEQPSRFEWAVSLGRAMNGGAVVEWESISDLRGAEPRPLLLTDDKGARVVLPEVEGMGPPAAVRSSGKLSFEEIMDAERFHTLDILKGVISALHMLGSLATAPAWARVETAQPSPRDSLVIAPRNFLDRQGLGLANVLYSLFTNHADAWTTLERSFRGEFPFVRRIVFPPDIGGSKIAFAYEDERFPERKLFASEMSDGMIAYLCLLAAVLHPHHLGLLGLDEPDTNLHPSALRRLISLTHRDHAWRRLVIVTHSNALLDELRDPARSIRVVESTKDGALIRKLDPEALAAWRKDYSVSEMRRTGLLDPPNSAYGTKE